MSSTWGERLKISIFGGSHSRGIGVTVSGLPAGEKIDMEQVLLQMSRRAPGSDPTATARKEADFPEILCGMSPEGILHGDPVSAVIFNSSQHSSDYKGLDITPRPGHADFSAFVKYNGYNEISGGGHFSGRLTAPLVFAGALCRQILKKRGIFIGAHASEIGGVCDEPFDYANIDLTELERLSSEFFPVRSAETKEKMREKIAEKKSAGDSVGGVITCAVAGLPAGVGDPMFDGCENLIASIVFGIPAVKGVSFGAGFGVAGLCGSENNDPWYYDESGNVKSKTNNAGGILGGITTGMPLVFHAAIKPTPSIGMEQDTIYLDKKTEAILAVKGRHDPCIVPRAIPVVEAAAAVAVTELLLREGRLSV